MVREHKNDMPYCPEDRLTAVMAPFADLLKTVFRGAHYLIQPILQESDLLNRNPAPFVEVRFPGYE
jgi:hypothetical protein